MDFSFKGIKEALVKKLKEYSEWSIEILTVGVYSSLLDLVAFIIEKLAYYVDFLFIETTYNATLRSSVVKLAKDHGYIPLRKSGAIGYLILGSDSTFSSESLKYEGDGVEVLRWTQFQSSDSQVQVYCTEDTRLVKNSFQKTLHPNPGTISLNFGDIEVGITITSHGLSAGDKVYITGTDNFDGIFLLTDKTSENKIVFKTDYIKETFTGLENIRAGYAFISIREGVTQNYTYVAVGSINEKIPLYSDSIDQNEIQVYLVDVNENVLYEIPIVDDLYFVNQTSTYTCEIENFYDYTGIFIKFGDNITSKQLVENDRILIKYAITKGYSGNVDALNIVTQPLIPFISVLNNIEDLYLTNIEAISGGSDLQSLLDIKKQYSKLYKSSYQLTSRDAWIAAIQEKQYVYRAYVWSQLDVDEGTLSLTGTYNQNLHYITAVNNLGNALTSVQESDITLNVLIPRKSPTDIVYWQKLDKIGIKFSVFAEIKNTISFADMKTEMIKTLNSNFGVLNLEFSENVYMSNYIRILDSISGVIRHETTAYYVEEDIEITETSLKDFLVSKSATDGKNVNQVVSDSVQIWIRRKILGTWYSPVQIGYSQLSTIRGMNQYTISGNIAINSGTSVLTNVDKLNYQIFDLFNNIVPCASGTGTTYDSRNTITMVSVTGISVGMYLKGTNIEYASMVTEIVVSTNTVIINKVTGSTPGTGTIKFSWFPDMEGTFGARNPDDSQDTGYVLYLLYQTKDMNGDRIGDLRLSKFNQILDFNEDLSVFDYIYP